MNVAGRSVAALVLAAALVTGATASSQEQHQGHHSGAPAQSPPASMAQSEAMKGYTAAMNAMHGPMMQAVKDSDPDTAFVKGMIPHHQGAIDMAKVVLQHGKDEQVKKWANDVIREQQREIAEMQEWLKKRGK